MGNLFKKSKKSKVSTFKRIESFRNSKKVCAIFDYISMGPGELSFEINDILLANIKSNRLWWYAKHLKSSKTGYIPRHLVVNFDQFHVSLPGWFDISNVDANRKLMKSDQALGTYIIHPCSDQQNLVLSVKCEKNEQHLVKSYKITVGQDEYYIFRSAKFPNLADLIDYYYFEFEESLEIRLVQAYVLQEKPSVQFRHVEVDRSNFEILNLIGRGHFGEVYRARHRKNRTIVAVKILLQCHEDRKMFIKEAKLMHQLHHERIVKLLGVCTKPIADPMYIITEFMENGSLLSFIKKNDKRQLKFRDMLIILMEIADGMSYLESKSFIHRDLRAANILVGKDRSVKVADFGLARLVEEIYVPTEEDYEFPVRWMAHEVLLDHKFTLKSDVWSFGILMFELITFGQIPYPDIKSNNQVANRVKRGYKMPMPTGLKIKCTNKYYSTMQHCWSHHRERPSFADLYETFKDWADLDSGFTSE